MLRPKSPTATSGEIKMTVPLDGKSEIVVDGTGTAALEIDGTVEIGMIGMKEMIATTIATNGATATSGMTVAGVEIATIGKITARISLMLS